MSVPNRNLLANFAGTGWNAAVTLALVPFYLHVLGAEGFGLVGFFTTLSSVLWLFDLGLSTTLNRELASMKPSGSQAFRARDLVKTLATLYWGFAALLALTVMLSAPWLASRWLQPESLAVESVTSSIRLMALVIGLQFPFAIYAGGLLGIHRHVALNGVIVAAVTVRGVVTVLVLTLVSSTVEAFFICQLAAWALQTAATRAALLRYLPAETDSGKFRTEQLRRLARFAIGITVITAAGALLTQIDKIVLSRLLSLQDFGYYVLASTLATGLSVIAAPFFASIFPRFTQLVSNGEEELLRLTYHQTAQRLSLLVLPAAVVLALFPREILMLWTGSGDIAVRSAPLLTLLSVGFAANAVMHIPYALQLAHGWTRLALSLNVAGVIFLVPLSILGARQFGGMGTATVWLALNLLYVSAGVPLMHRRLLRGEAGRWYLQDVGVPLAIALLIAVPARFLLTSLQPASVLPILILITFLTFSSVAVLTPTKVFSIGSGKSQEPHA